MGVLLKNVGLANPPRRYSQQEVANLMGVKNQKLRRFFDHKHIQHRHLYLPPVELTLGTRPREGYGELLEKFVRGATEMGGEALSRCLEEAGVSRESIEYLCCVTSTGFIVPTLSALFIKHFGLRHNCQRSDLVGMGCNAGLNGLNTVASWCLANPGKNALLVCVEVCSAIYAVDETPRTAMVNSLFGDGAAVALLRCETGDTLIEGSPRILDFESLLIPDHHRDLRFDWDEEQGRYSFFVGKEAPSAIAAVCDIPLSRLLARHQLKAEQITHWVLHGGGSSVLAGIQDKLRLSEHSLRHTRSVLRDFGNLSSGSFLFSFERLVQERTTAKGDYGILMTMGPGLTIEMGLLRW